MGTKELLRAYTDMPWLRAAVGKVSSSIAGTEWQLFRATKNGRTQRTRISRMDYATRKIRMNRMIKQGTLDQIEDHEILNLLYRGNDFITGLDLWKHTQATIDLVGEAFWLQERDGRGLPIQLWPLAPNWVLSTPHPGGVASFTVRIEGSAKEVDVPMSEIVWIRDPNPSDPYGRGSGTARSLADELETDEYAAKHTKSWFLNGARPDFIVSADGLRRDETERMERDWNHKHKGFWRAFRAQFLNRKVDITPISQTFDDMQLTELRKHERDTVVQVYGVPPEILGILQASNRATIESAGFLFSRWVLVPRLELLRACLQRSIVDQFDDRIILDFETPVEEDKEFRAKVIDSAPWAFEVDEIRAQAGLDPKKDGTGKVHFIPQKFRAVASLDPDTVNEAVAEGSQEPNNEDREEDDDEE